MRAWNLKRCPQHVTVLSRLTVTKEERAYVSMNLSKKRGKI